MKTFENITDILIIKEHIDHALSNLYEGKPYDRNFDALGHELTIYIKEGRYEMEVCLMSDKLDTIYVLSNHTGHQANIIEELTK